MQDQLENLLPHFDVRFRLRLAAHLEKRIRQVQEEGRDEADRSGKSWPWWSVRYQPRGLANHMVDRIHQTQLHEAKGVLSFSEAIIDWDRKHNPNRRINKPREGDPKAFSEVVNKVRAKVGAAALEEEY